MEAFTSFTLKGCMFWQPSSISGSTNTIVPYEAIVSTISSSAAREHVGAPSGAVTVRGLLRVGRGSLGPRRARRGLTLVPLGARGDAHGGHDRHPRVDEHLRGVDGPLLTRRLKRWTSQRVD